MKHTAEFEKDDPQILKVSQKNSSKISFSTFLKIILANSRMRKQVRDIVDLALFDFALQKNIATIDSIKQKAEAESIQMLMQITKGVSHYEMFREIIHRNRIIKILANLDKNAHQNMINRITRRLAV